ncbi:MAG TPA: type II 3-dehydroquinate dehydratase [Bacteroidales bacterium]|nr:type II 3-dehydroquinate dehydratase [Bacteroidales bacterium]
MKISIINGPNLNLLGRRERKIYGDMTFESFFQKLKAEFSDIDLEYFQSNVEGELVSFVQQAGKSSDGIILNAAGYTHTSVVLADAVGSIDTPVIEVHISNILAREKYRHTSLIAPWCRGSLFGFGLNGYILALHAFVNRFVTK